MAIRSHLAYRSTTGIRAGILGAGICALAVSVAGCGSQGIYAVPLPGGPDVGSDPIEVTAVFEDVLDLVPQSQVRADGVAVGQIDSVTVADDGWSAEVAMSLSNDVDLPANAIAKVEQTNLLGEKFINLSAPSDKPDSARLRDGAVIPLNRTMRTTEVEELFGAVSLLFNGGGLGQLQPIISELRKSMDGRTPEVRSLIEQATTLVTGLNEQRDDIARALDGLDVLTARLRAQTGQIQQVVQEIPQGVQVLTEQTPQFVDMLKQLDRLGRVGTDVIMNSKDNVIAELRALAPVLEKLHASGADFPNAFKIFPTFPISDNATALFKAGQGNLYAGVDLEVSNTLANLGVGQGDPVYRPPAQSQPSYVDPSNPYYNGNGPRPGWPTVSLVPLPPNSPGPLLPTVVAPLLDIPGQIGAIINGAGLGPR